MLMSRLSTDGRNVKIELEFRNRIRNIQIIPHIKSEDSKKYFLPSILYKNVFFTDEPYSSMFEIF